MIFIQLTLPWLCDAPIMVRKCWKPRKAHMYLRENKVFLKKRKRRKKKKEEEEDLENNKIDRRPHLPGRDILNLVSHAISLFLTILLKHIFKYLFFSSEYNVLYLRHHLAAQCVLDGILTRLGQTRSRLACKFLFQTEEEVLFKS